MPYMNLNADSGFNAALKNLEEAKTYLTREQSKDRTNPSLTKLVNDLRGVIEQTESFLSH
jgi:hypothetical protein